MKVNELEVNRRTVTYGEYRGVCFEAVRWELCGETRWNYYIIPDISKLSPQAAYKYNLVVGSDGHADFMTGDGFDAISWHGGLTYYSRISNKLVKAGCDYGHGFDHGKTYTLAMVLDDMKNTVDSYLAAVAGELDE